MTFIQSKNKREVFDPSGAVVDSLGKSAKMERVGFKKLTPK